MKYKRPPSVVLSIELPLVNLENLKTGLPIRNIGVITGGNNTEGLAVCIIASRQGGIRRVADINHLEAGMVISHIGVIASDSDPEGVAGRVVAPGKRGVCRIANIDHLETARRAIRQVCVIALDGNAQRGARCIHGFPLALGLEDR